MIFNIQFSFCFYQTFVIPIDLNIRKKIYFLKDNTIIFLYYAIDVLVFFCVLIIYIRLSSQLSQTKVDDFIRSDILYNKLGPFQFRFCSKIHFFYRYHLHIVVLGVICLVRQLTIKGLPLSFFLFCCNTTQESKYFKTNSV
jgi:hypothetical protein